MFASCHACVCIKVEILVAFWASSTCSKCCVRIIPSVQSDKYVTLDFILNGMYLHIARATFSVYTKTLFFFTWYQNHDSYRTIDVFKMYSKFQMLWATACGVAGCRYACTVTADGGFAHSAHSNALVKFDSHVSRNEQNTKIQILHSQGWYIVCTSGIILVFKAGCVHPFVWPRFFTHSQKTRLKKIPTFAPFHPL